MNFSEVLYLVIGLAAALVAGRLGIPLPGVGKPAQPTGDALRTLVRDVLLEVLQGLTRPQSDPNEPLREQLRAVVAQKQ